MDELLIVGAGPTGLMLAVWLAQCGVRARIVEPKPGPTPETRAVTLQARTLEFWNLLGIADRALARGRQAAATNVWVDERVAARLPLGEVGQGLSPYPFVLILPQSETEAILYDRLRELGGEVEWGTRVDSVEGNRVTFGDGSEGSYRFVLGCDGASSVVRKGAGLGFPGGTYTGRFFVADVDAEGEVVPGEVNVAFLRDRFFAFFPLKDENRYRMVGLLPPGVDPETATVEAVRGEIESRMKTRIDRVRWFSVYRVHHRVVERFRRGSVFLLGDAAHVHSPVGGQGMNTGLGDAANLAWKLVEVLRHGADETLLDTYDAERRPFARSLVATTDRAFALVTRDAAFARLLRTRFLPVGLRLALRFQPFRRLAFLTVSQTRISYRKGPLAVGDLGRFRGGDRLPPYPDDGARPDRWRLVVAPSPTRGAETWCAAHDVDLRVTPKGAVALLVRPDGYIGLAASRFDAAAFDRYLHDQIRRPGESER